MREVESNELDDYHQLRLPLKDVRYVYRATDAFSDHKPPVVSYHRQLYLTHLPDGLIAPAEFQRVYESGSSRFLYSVSTRYEKETGEMISDGKGMVVVSHDITSDSGEVVRQESLHIGYDEGKANYVSSIVTDVTALRRRYDSGEEKGQSVQTVALSYDGFDEHPASQRVLTSDGNLSINLVFSSEEEQNGQVIERGERVLAPALLTSELSHLLMAEGKDRLGSDSDRSIFPDIEEGLSDTDTLIYQVPKRFPVTFTPFESRSSK